MFSDRGFEIGETDGLQAHVGVVEVPDRRLDEQDFHGFFGGFPVDSKSNIARAVGKASIERAQGSAAFEPAAKNCGLEGHRSFIRMTLNYPESNIAILRSSVFLSSQEQELSIQLDGPIHPIRCWRLAVHLC
jgi:hypothetical protein